MSEISKIYVKLRGYDAKVVDRSAQSILETAVRTGSRVVGPIPLPRKRHVYAVNRSTFVHKRSIEHFEIREHLRLLIISEPTPKTIDSLQHLQMPAGVEIQIKMKM